MNTAKNAVRAMIVPIELNVEKRINGRTISGAVSPLAALPNVRTRAIVRTTVKREQKIIPPWNLNSFNIDLLVITGYIIMVLFKGIVS